MFWRVLAFIGGLTFIGTGLSVLGDETCKTVDWGGSRRALTVTCYAGSQGETSAGTAAALTLLAGLGLILLSTWPFIRTFLPSQQVSVSPMNSSGTNRRPNPSPPPPPAPLATRQQKIDASKSFISEQRSNPEPTPIGSAFADAEQYAREHADHLSPRAVSAVYKASQELRHLVRQHDSVWVFSDTSHPFVVALRGGNIYEIGWSGSRMRSARAGLPIAASRDKLGHLSLTIGDRTLDNLQPKENAERLINLLRLEVGGDVYEGSEGGSKSGADNSSDSDVPSTDALGMEGDQHITSQSTDESPSRFGAEQSTPDIESRLRTLKSLFDQGLISEGDFAERRREILGEL